jgi:hypothetical protein
MHKSLQMLIVGVVLNIGAVAMVSAATGADPTDGTWTLNVAKSKFSPGPAPQSHTRSYATTSQGVALTYSVVSADGTKTSGQSNYKYDGKDYPITGSPDFDTLAVTRIDAFTAKSVQKKNGKSIGTTLRTVSKDGKVLTLSSKGTSAAGTPYNNVLVFDKQ